MKKNSNMLISIIIPVLNEQDSINDIIIHIQSIMDSKVYEIIIVDGDSLGSTISHVKDKRCKKLIAPRGRALQLNRGSEHARGSVLLFLHADTLLPKNAYFVIQKVFKDERYIGGAFDLSFNSNHRWIRFVAAVARRRSRLTRIPFGDQAVFIQKEYFDSIGKFKEIPLMEDVELMQRIKKRGGAIYITSERVITSARKWKEEGPYYTTFRNWALQFLFMLGVKPETLIKYYYKNT